MLIQTINPLARISHCTCESSTDKHMMVSKTRIYYKVGAIKKVEGPSLQKFGNYLWMAQITAQFTWSIVAERFLPDPLACKLKKTSYYSNSTCNSDQIYSLLARSKQLINIIVIVLEGMFGSNAAGHWKKIGLLGIFFLIFEGKGFNGPLRNQIKLLSTDSSLG